MLTKIFLNDINLEFIKKYLRIEEDFTEDDIELQLYLDSAKSYVCNYLNLDIEELNDKQEVAICILMLVANFYENKSINTAQNNIDKTFKSLLDLHKRWL